jgi:hypothetical protein
VALCFPRTAALSLISWALPRFSHAWYVLHPTPHLERSKNQILRQRSKVYHTDATIGV